jgi:hypothetical protein
MNVPLSFCLPKECGHEAIFQPLMQKLTVMANNLFGKLHEKVDFDNLYYQIPNNTLDSQLLK